MSKGPDEMEGAKELITKLEGTTAKQPPKWCLPSGFFPALLPCKCSLSRMTHSGQRLVFFYISWWRCIAPWKLLDFCVPFNPTTFSSPPPLTHQYMVSLYRIFANSVFVLDCGQMRANEGNNTYLQPVNLVEPSQHAIPP